MLRIIRSRNVHILLKNASNVVNNTESFRKFGVVVHQDETKILNVQWDSGDRVFKRHIGIPSHIPYI